MDHAARVCDGARDRESRQRDRQTDRHPDRRGRIDTFKHTIKKLKNTVKRKQMQIGGRIETKCEGEILLTQRVRMTCTTIPLGVRKTGRNERECKCSRNAFVLVQKE